MLGGEVLAEWQARLDDLFALVAGRFRRVRRTRLGGQRRAVPHRARAPRPGRAALVDPSARPSRLATQDHTLNRDASYSIGMITDGLTVDGPGHGLPVRNVSPDPNAKVAR